MDSPDHPLIELLLRTSSSVVLEMDAEGRLLQILGGPELAQWLPTGTLPPAGLPLAETLTLLFDATHSARIVEQHDILRSRSEPASLTCPMLPGRPVRLAATRWFDVTSVRLAGDCTVSLLLITERTQHQQLADSASSAQAALDLALLVLRTDAASLRQFLQTATSAIGFIRSTLRQPARTQESLRDKLGLLLSEARMLSGAADRMMLRHIAMPCLALVTDLEALLARDSLSGDDMLPLALRIDPLSAAIGATISLDEQRAPPAASTVPPAAVGRPLAPRPPAAWHEICEQRTNDLIQRLGTRFGVLAQLRMKGSALVPERYQRQIEILLEPLILNALKHGIESPEQRLAVNKQASGKITVTFRNRDAAGLEMSVHDDGRGFDLVRIEAAARVCGMVEAGNDSPDPRELVGMIFKPGFSTAALEQMPGDGQGMALLRESLHRQGGNISVATKPLRYTQFTLRLPARDAVAARQRPSRRDLAGAAAPQP